MKINIDNSLFEGLNSTEGLFICGYEWGDSENTKSDEEPKNNVEYTFANKWKSHGEIARKYPYDNTIKKWFRLWEHELNEENPGDFEKSIIQTNWCNTQNNKIDYLRLAEEEQKKNFLYHIEMLKPRLILFFGSQCIETLNHQTVKPDFMKLCGKELSEKKLIQKKCGALRRFKIGFQEFETCDLISLPHPSGSRGLSDDYIELFKPEIGERIQKFKKYKGIE